MRERVACVLDFNFYSDSMHRSVKQNEGNSAFNSFFPGWSHAVATCCRLSACVVIFCPSKLNMLTTELGSRKYERAEYLQRQDSVNWSGK